MNNTVADASGSAQTALEEQLRLDMLSLGVKNQQAEETTRREREEVDLLLSSIESILIGLDTSGVITRWNSTAARIFGIKPEDAVGRPLHACGISWNQTPVQEIVKKSKEFRQSENLVDLRYKRCDGREGILGFRVTPLGVKNGNVVGFLWHGADVTERRLQASQLLQAQKLESIGRLAAGIAHEINTPAQYVGDNTKFLNDAFASLCTLLRSHEQLLQAARSGSVSPELIAEVERTADETDSEYLLEEIPKAIEQSLEGIDRVTKIVRAMKDFSHPGTDQLKPADLNKAILSTITVSRNEWKYVAEMATDFDTNLPLVPCLLAGFNQAILNMIVNAAHAIEDANGPGREKKGTISVSTRRIGDWAEIRISDTGTGIPEAARAHVFDPFFTTKDPGRGTGQGLTIAHSVIVEKLGGSLNFETEAGRGTTFIIRLPIEPNAS
jgi:PAS domain S-box-containing protein